jgi:hypothetical protein
MLQTVRDQWQTVEDIMCWVVPKDKGITRIRACLWCNSQVMTLSGNALPQWDEGVTYAVNIWKKIVSFNASLKWIFLVLEEAMYVI